MTVDEVRSILRQYSLGERETESVIEILKSNVPAERREDLLEISGIMYSSGFNIAFLTDHDTWDFDVTFKSNETGQLVTLPNFYAVDFRNGGFKIELSYKWMFVVVPSGTSIQSLNGAQYGRGLGVTVNPGLGIDAAWMPGHNRAGHLILVAPKVGVGAGLVFPRMDFEAKAVVGP